MNTARTLRTAPVGDIDTLAKPEIDEVVSLESPAYEIFTDFTHHHPIVIDSDLSVPQAEAFMQRAHVKLALVVDQRDRFLGMLSYGDLIGDRYQQLLGQGTAQEAISVKAVMVHRDELRAVAYEELAGATIGMVVDTLQKEHRQHFLVVDDQPKIRGIFSASDIARRLHVAIDIAKAPTFADICHVMFGHTHP